MIYKGPEVFMASVAKRSRCGRKLCVNGVLDNFTIKLIPTSFIKHYYW